MAVKQNYTFRFDPDLINRLDAAAKIVRRSRTNLVEVIIAEYLDQVERSGSDNREAQPQ